MANNARSEIEVELGGKRYTLRPSFNAIMATEDAAGTSIPDLLQLALKGKLGFKGYAALVYGGLVGAGIEKFSFLEVGELMQKKGLSSYSKTAGAILREMITPEVEQEATASGKKPKGPKAQGPTG